VEDLFFTHHNLGNPGSVAEVNECHTTVIATAANPAGEGDGLSNVLGTEGSEVMCAQHSIPFSKIFNGSLQNDPVRVYPPRWNGTATA
jgi:hypothetical protein